MKKLMVMLMLLGLATSLSADALDDAVAHWGFEDGTDLNGPPNSDLTNFGGTDITGEPITAPNANTWAHEGSAYNGALPADSEVLQSGAMTVFARVMYPTAIDMGTSDQVTMFQDHILGAVCTTIVNNKNT